MSKENSKALLPAGLQDLLSPAAAHEAAVTEGLIASIARAGYERIKPPLLEFEQSLFSGTGQALSQQTFRLMDPVSQNMMGVRADITPQAVRVATTRLCNHPRPLRLCYAGEILQIRGSHLRPERQFRQVGAELIGASAAEADAEVILHAVEALEQMGVQGLSVDLNMPTVVSALMTSAGQTGEDAQNLREALDRKDAAEVARQVDAPWADLFLGLLDTTGPAEQGLARARTLNLSGAAREALDRVERVVELLHTAKTDLSLTLDLVEHRGFEYHTGLGFIFFAPTVHGELGRGGRYDLQADDSATGFTLYMDRVLRALPEPEQPRRLYLPHATPYRDAVTLREQGWITVAGLQAENSIHAAARAQNCTRIFLKGQVLRTDGTTNT